MHDSGNPFDRTFASSELFGSSGVNFAIVDGYSTIEASLRGRGQFIQPGMDKTHKTMVCNSIHMYVLYMPYMHIELLLRILGYLVMVNVMLIERSNGNSIFGMVYDVWMCDISYTYRD